MSSTTSPFGQNEWLVEEMYRKFRDDPSSVDPSWHEFLVDYNPEPTTDAAPAAAGNGEVAAAPPAPKQAAPATPAPAAEPAKAAAPAKPPTPAPAKPATRCCRSM